LGSTKIIAPDAEVGDNFGYSASISGDYVIIGAYNKSSATGAAYIFHRTGTNTWDTGTKIIAYDAAAGDYFGTSVSISGDYAIVGADIKNYLAGAAYIFHRTGTNTWDAGTKITCPSGGQFGYSVSIDGDYVIVGANHDDSGGFNAGAAYIFHRTGTNTWDTGTKIMASDATAGDLFGTSVSISGDYAIVGAHFQNVLTGAAYIYRRTGTNTWNTGTKIVASDGSAGDNFGIAVSISGDYAIVGASEGGGAYVFYRIGINIWDAGTKIIALGSGGSKNLVSIDGDYTVVGAWCLNSDTGAAYIFHRTGVNTWDTGVEIEAFDGVSPDSFGISVSIDGNYIVVGAYRKDSYTGAAYIFAI